MFNLLSFNVDFEAIHWASKKRDICKMSLRYGREEFDMVINCCVWKSTAEVINQKTKPVEIEGWLISGPDGIPVEPANVRDILILIKSQVQLVWETPSLQAFTGLPMFFKYPHILEFTSLWLWRSYDFKFENHLRILLNL